MTTEKDLRDGRTIRRVYPWADLSRKGLYFDWYDIGDAQKIRSAARYQKYKVSVRTISIGLVKRLRVVRVS